MLTEPNELLVIFNKFFRGSDEGVIMEHVKAVIEAYDVNGDGKLQFTEFVEMVHLGNFWARYLPPFSNPTM